MALSAAESAQAPGLRAAGADLVLAPFADAAEHAARQLAEAVAAAPG